jgi:hypothetical protein
VIELRGLVASAGQAPLTAAIRVGEVVRLDGDPAATRAVIEVIAGRRAAIAGAVRWRDRDGRGVVIRAGEALPPGIDGEAAAALWGALSGGRGRARAVGAGEAGAAARRGFGAAPVVWLVDGAVEEGAEAVVAAADEDVRGGSGALAWTAAAGRGRADRAILVEAVAPSAARPTGQARAGGDEAAIGGARRVGDRARAAVAIARFAIAAAGSRGALATGAVAALWLAITAAVLAVHEGHWFLEGSRAGLAWIARLAGLGAAAIAASSAATRAAVARAWLAMLRETGASPAARLAALAAGDIAGAVPAALVAACPAVWSAGALADAGVLRAALAAALAVSLAAALAAAVTRGLRVGPLPGLLVGVGVAAALVW